ncbi:MAG: hypothetical protein AB1772_07680 [Candidatus Zixiibacteriota bacterium]
MKTRLETWRQGVWISGTATYTIYTDKHYFVISDEGDSSAPNLYVGASQVVFHEKGTARRQLMRLRRLPDGALNAFREIDFAADHEEPSMEIDTTLFVPGTCTIKDGIIYDAVTEVTDTSILLSTCNGDTEVIYSNGVSVYMPAGGGEFYSYRIEVLSF